MISDPDLQGIVRTFLEDGADRMPDRVYRAAMDAVPGTRRRHRAWWSVIRPAAPAGRAVLVAALAVAVLVGGVSLLSAGGRVGVGPSPSPVPASQPPSSTPAATAPASEPASEPASGPASAPVSGLPTGGPVALLADGTDLGAGTYEVGEPFQVPFTITLPAGSRFGSYGPGQASFEAPGGSLQLYLPDAVFGDPCHVTASPAPTRTVAEVVSRLTTMAGVSATAPTSTTVAGHQAKTFVLTNTIDTATAGCTRGPMLPLFSYVGETEDGAATNGGTRQVAWVVDVDGRPLLVIGDGWDDVVRSDLEALVATISIP